MIMPVDAVRARIIEEQNEHQIRNRPHQRRVAFSKALSHLPPVSLPMAPHKPRPSPNA